MTILPFLMGASGRPQLKSSLLRARGMSSPTGGTEPITVDSDVAGPATLVFMHFSRTNSGTGDEQLGAVSLSGHGSFTRRYGNDSGGLASNPRSIWTRDITGLTGSLSVVWDYTGAGQTVRAAIAIWVVYGRPHTLSAGTSDPVSRPAGGIVMQGVYSTSSSPAAQGYTEEDLNYSPSDALYVRMGRWYGPTAGSHAGGTMNITFTPT